MSSKQEKELERQLSTLTPDELDQYEAEIRGQSQDQAPEPASDDIFAQTGAVRLSTSDLPAGLSPTSEKDAVEKAAIEALPFSKDLLAGAEAVGDVLSEKEFGIDEIGERYQANKADWDQAINESAEKHPVISTVTDLGVSFALPVARTLKGAMAFGALSTASRLEDRNPYDFIKASVTGALFGGLGVGAGHLITSAGSKMVNFVGQKIGMVGNRAGTDAIMAPNKGFIVKLNQHVKKFWNKEGNLTADEATQKFSGSMMKHKVDGEDFLVANQTFERTAEKAGILKDKFGNQLGEAMDVADEGILHSTQSIHDDILVSLKVVASKGENRGLATVEIAKDAEKMLKLQFKHTVDDGMDKVTNDVISKVVDANGNPIVLKVQGLVPKTTSKHKEMTLKELFQLKQDITKNGFAAKGFKKADAGVDKHMIKAAEDMDTAVVNAISRKIESVIDGAAAKAGKGGKVLPKDVSSLRELNRQWADMNIVETLANKSAEEMSAGTMSGLRSLMSGKGLLTTALLKASGMKGATSVVLAAVLNKVSSDPRTAASAAVGLTKIASAIRVDPNSPYIKQMIVAAAVSSDALREKVASIGSEINLLESPVSRTSSSLYEKSDDVITLLQDKDPALADALRQAVRNQDTNTMAQIMDQVSKLPGVAKFIKPGLGWDGKVFTPEDVQNLSEKVKGTDISARQKQEHLNKLRDDGTIPVMQQEPERFFKFKQRDKSKPQY